MTEDGVTNVANWPDHGWHAYCLVHQSWTGPLRETEEAAMLDALRHEVWEHNVK